MRQSYVNSNDQKELNRQSQNSYMFTDEHGSVEKPFKNY